MPTPHEQTPKVVTGKIKDTQVVVPPSLKSPHDPLFDLDRENETVTLG